MLIINENFFDDLKKKKIKNVVMVNYGLNFYLQATFQNANATYSHISLG